MVELKELKTAYKGLREVLTEKFKPINSHLEDAPNFRDKVVKNCTSIFFLRIMLIPIFLGILMAAWKAWGLK